MAPSFEATDDVGFIRVEDIVVGERLRPVDPVWADAIGSAMARDGQMTPIVVCKSVLGGGWRLVAGAHRVEGARLHGIEHLRAEIVGANPNEVRVREVSENLLRRGLDPVDKAAFIAAHVEAIKARKGITDANPHAVSVAARWERANNKNVKKEALDTTDILSVVYGWSDEAAEMLGITGRTVRRAIALHRQLPPSLVARLRAVRHPILQNAGELAALAKLDEGMMSSAVDLLLAGAAKRVGEARAVLLQRPKPEPGAKRLSAFIGAFSRMGVAERKDALRELAELLPKGWLITERGIPFRPADAS